MSHRDTQLEKLQGSLKAFQDALDSGLASAGARFGGGAPAPQQSGTPAPNVPPGAETAPADLGVTGGYRQKDVPPISAQPSGGGPLRYLRKPDGTVVPTMKSDVEIELLKAAGYQLVNK
jgi:hypothetical protein